MKILINTKDKDKVEKLLKDNGFNARWEGNYLLVASSNYDFIYDVLCDNNIEF